MENENQTPPPPKRPRGRPRLRANPTPLAPGAESEAAAILGGRGHGIPKTLTDEERQRRANHAREMTRRRVAIRGIVVNADSNEAPPTKPGRARIQGSAQA